MFSIVLSPMNFVRVSTIVAQKKKLKPNPVMASTDKNNRNSKWILVGFIFCSTLFLLGVDCKKLRKGKTHNTHSSTIGVPDCVVKLALVLCDEKSTEVGNNFERQINQTIVSIKSILITLEEDSCAHVILITNKKTHFNRIKTEIFGNPEKWDIKFTSRLKLEYVALKYPEGREWMKGLYRNRPCSSFRLFLADVLPYDAVILSDTDIIYLRDIKYLWAVLEKFNASTVLSMAPVDYSINPKRNNSFPIPRYKNSGLRAGVMVMNLTRMRSQQWTKKVLNASAPYLSFVKNAKAEQDMLGVYFYYFPTELRELSCDWNFAPHKCIHPRGICLQRLISGLHGVTLAFADKGNEPLFYSVFQTFMTTHLTANFDLRTLITRLKLGMNSDNAKKNGTCSKIGNINTLIIGRLEQKLGSAVKKRDALGKRKI